MFLYFMFYLSIWYCLISTEVLNSYFTCDSERYDANKQGFVIAEQSNEAKLGESCILVEKNDVFSKSGFQDVQKSNKVRHKKTLILIHL